MEESLMDDVEEIDTIIAELEISKGKGNLILCVVNSPAYRNSIILTLRGRFLSKVIYVEKGEQIIRFLKEPDLDGADILIWVMPEEPTEDLLNTLNNFRELFYEVKIPNILFYNRAFSESVIRKAPDFWRYRGNYYELEEAERGMTFEAIETLATPFSYQDKEDLLRRKRINEYLLEMVRDKEEKANILTELGRIFYNFGEINKALKYFEKALKLNEELGNKEGIAANLGNIGTVYRIRGELDNALEYYGKALKLNEELGRKEGMANQLGNIGTVYKTKGELDKALEYHRKALKLNEELGIKEGIAIQLRNIGDVYYTRGEHDKALGYYKKAFKSYKEMGIKIGTARTLIKIGDVFTQKGDKERAFDYYQKAERLAAGSPVFEDVRKRLNKQENKLLTQINAD